MQKLILFGASNLGKKAYEDLHNIYDILYFCDNDKNKHGKEINGIEIISFEKLLKINNSKITIIITSYYISEIEEQLIKASVYNYLTYEEVTIIAQPNRYKKALEELRNKEKIKVAFFALYSSVWKYNGLYQLMMGDSRFDPIIIVCPVVNYGKEHMLIEMEKTYSFFKKKNYNVVKTYNKENDSFLDVKKEIHPDIIFFTNPHPITKEKYYIRHFLDILTCYSPYGIMVANIEELQYDQLFHNILWKAYYETQIHKKMAIMNSRNKGKNVIVTGSPITDGFVYGYRIGKNVWKNTNPNFKRVIWAPHHTIESEGQLTYSCFFQLHQFMLDIANIYKNKMQIAFKPHPLLKEKLIRHREWGEARTNKYYQQWSNLENGQLETDNYVELFNSSDAMIFDSASFIAEYLYCGKPSLFTFRNSKVKDQFNEFGKIAIEQHYHAVNERQIVDFMEKVVCNGEDVKRKKRIEFFEKNLITVNNRTASENIFYDLCESIW